MPYDLRPLLAHVAEETPVGVADQLDRLLYDLVMSAEYRKCYDELGERYLALVTLRDVFAMMAESTGAESTAENQDLSQAWK